MIPKSHKIVVVGDGMVGKTALLSAFMNDYFNQNYIPTVFETSAKDVELNDGRQITLGLWDTGGQEEFDQIRQLAYPGANLILVCYAVDCPTSLENVLATWIHEVKCYCPSIPLILVGCKADRRHLNATNSHSHSNSNGNLITNSSSLSEESSMFITPQMAQKVGKLIGAHIVIECSALHNSNVHTVFELAGRFILDLKKPTEKKSSFLRRLHCNSFNNGTKNCGDNNNNNNNSPAENKENTPIKESGLIKRISIKRNNSSLKNRLNSPNYICFIRRHH